MNCCLCEEQSSEKEQSSFQCNKKEEVCVNDVNDEAVVAQEVGYRDEQLNEVGECAVKGATARPQDDKCATTEENVVYLHPTTKKRRLPPLTWDEQLIDFDETAGVSQDDNTAAYYEDVLVEFVESSDQVNTAHSTRKSWADDYIKAENARLMCIFHLNIGISPLIISL